MPKQSFFQFKQFRVNQGQCGMKVCTDACILGAWAGLSEARRILDIGAGTGLLSLMLAQRHSQAHIDAIEIDAPAAQQCRENFEESPWSNRLQVVEMPVQEYAPHAQYDLIVSNPPFFPNHLLSNDGQRNKAIHATTLSFSDLAEAAGRLLAHHGEACMMLPPRQATELAEAMSEQGLLVRRSLRIADSEGKPPIRQIDVYARNAAHSIENCTFYIKNDQQQYTEAFSSLLADYYLIF